MLTEVVIFTIQTIAHLLQIFMTTKENLILMPVFFKAFLKLFQRLKVLEVV